MNKPKVTIMSFGFKYGRPFANYIFDVSFLKNPKFKDEWSENIWTLTPDMREYVMKQKDAQDFIKKIVPFMKLVASRTDCIFAIGCTGGHHRSVAIAEEIERKLYIAGFDTKLVHRDAHD